MPQETVDKDSRFDQAWNKPSTMTDEERATKLPWSSKKSPTPSCSQDSCLGLTCTRNRYTQTTCSPKRCC